MLIRYQEKIHNVLGVDNFGDVLLGEINTLDKFKGFPVDSVTTDDFGDKLYLYTKGIYYNHILHNTMYSIKENVSHNDAVVIGSTIPNVDYKALIPIKNLPDHKKSIQFFHQSEMNCNTCKNLERIKHGKDSSGFLYGKCTSKDFSNKIYDGNTKEKMKFHPDDPMHMPCYVSRFDV